METYIPACHTPLQSPGWVPEVSHPSSSVNAHRVSTPGPPGAWQPLLSVIPVASASSEMDFSLLNGVHDFQYSASQWKCLFYFVLSLLFYKHRKLHPLKSSSEAFIKWKTQDLNLHARYFGSLITRNIACLLGGTDWTLLRRAGLSRDKKRVKLLSSEPKIHLLQKQESVCQMRPGKCSDKKDGLS